ncbi:MAG: ATP-binding protein [bacterium]|uniref:histidine kinase n=2 Tax=Bacteria candidate phyla TaxID=1783234 RepID=A0A117M666_UNCT6|nr:MAG: Histidine kinase [candidate division TA06 bacterium 32_111]KUK86542.1 MAG: Histidine kinase [candidate division TA06 bacterium 34_109]MDI6700724.1 ATP-binding protein [bacterium]HAF07891.1 ATP-binding protein [candidate division WOR-3 bacterium]HCP16407.1 ATP-binding protein [candidate division WOR-3 bacterium]
MRDISLHILDIAENSIRAKAKLVQIKLYEDKDQMRFEIIDDGVGMDGELLKMVLDPFFTTKDERKKKFGLGLPLLKQNVEQSDGKFKIESKKGEGTKIFFSINKNHIDALPLGNLEETLWILMTVYEGVDILFTYEKNGKTLKIDSRELKEVFKGLNLSDAQVTGYVKQFIKENLNSIKNQEAL